MDYLSAHHCITSLAVQAVNLFQPLEEYVVQLEVHLAIVVGVWQLLEQAAVIIGGYGLRAGIALGLGRGLQGGSLPRQDTQLGGIALLRFLTPGTGRWR